MPSEETPSNEKAVLARLNQENYFEIPGNLDRTRLLEQIAEEYGETPTWVKNVAVNNYGKDGRKIADDKILELLGMQDAKLEISVQKMNEDPPEGYVDIEGRERVYFISAAPTYVGKGAWKALTQKRDPAVGVGLVIINNGNNGCLSDETYNEHAESIRLEGLYCASVHSKGIGHAIDAGWLPREKEVPFSVADAIKGVFLSQDQAERIVRSLRTKRNIVLQGPPGVGKTFIAKRIAKCLIGTDDPSRIAMVQFHPSYSYEDFVQGWRPDGAGSFKLQNGPFLDFCKVASQRQGDFVFLIDEINRGELGKIFGELMMLIEGDKRGEEFGVNLTYESNTGDSFFVPENVHIIGLMNTADRSLAMIDYALRRRFAFHDIRPQFGSQAFKKHLEESGVELQVIEQVIERLATLNQRIANDSANLGPGFEIGHSFFCPQNSGESLGEAWYRGVIELEIEPLLREYWFDTPESVKKNVKYLLEGSSD